MTSNQSNNPLESIWQSQSVKSVLMTPDQLRARASTFQRRIRWRNIREYVAIGIVVPWIGLSIVHFQGVLARTGCSMLVIWALFAAYFQHRYGSSRDLPTTPGLQHCLAFHRQELERQRDFARSSPWGLAPAVPGFVLAVIGFSREGKHPDNWELPLALIGSCIFLCIAIALYNKWTADRLQLEIDGLDASNVS